ncbi:YidC/Oxa1 family membrane protein insertase [Patescibacteria group bacterium]|nr:YidC/Oxa1 family membrane protein insertase [Patescibacteria group bacterium]
MWHTLLYQPLVNGLIAFYKLFDNLGWAIINFTMVIRILLLPLTLPALKAAQKMKALGPKLGKLKQKYKGNAQKLAAAQMELYRSAGIKPLSGLLPQIIQIVILIALFQAFRQVLGNGSSVEELNKLLYPFLRFPAEAKLKLNFFYLTLDKPDLIDSVKIAGKSIPGIFLILSALSQFLSAKAMMPLSKKQEKIADKTPAKTDDFAAAMQTQSLYVFPLMTILIGFSFPSGLVLYWLVFSLFNLVQQIIISRKRGK